MRLFSVVIFVDNIAITCMVMKSLPQLGQLERAVSIVDMESIS
jgi:Iap family predicted aminopeptidase